MMTARECFRKVMRFEKADRVPMIPFEPLEEEAVKRWRAEGFENDSDRFLCFDLPVIAPLNVSPIPQFEHRVLSETDTEIVETDWLNATVKRKKSAPTLYYGYIDHPIKNMADWREYRKRLDPHAKGRLPADVAKAVRELNSSPQPCDLRLWPFYFRLGFYGMGMENFMVAFYDQPDLIHEMFEHWTTLIMEQLKVLFKAGLKIDYVAFAEDLAFKTSTHISPAIYREFWLPHQNKLVSLLRDNGVPVIGMWSAGNLEALLPILLDNGFNATWPCERMAGMDPNMLRKKYGKNLLLGGGIPKEALITGPSAIDAAIDELRPLIKSGGFIPALDDMVPTETPFQHYKHLACALKAACGKV